MTAKFSDSLIQMLETETFSIAPRIQGTSSSSIDVLFIQQTQRYAFIKC